MVKSNHFTTTAEPRTSRLTLRVQPSSDRAPTLYTLLGVAFGHQPRSLRSHTSFTVGIFIDTPLPGYMKILRW